MIDSKDIAKQYTTDQIKDMICNVKNRLQETIRKYDEAHTRLSGETLVYYRKSLSVEISCYENDLKMFDEALKIRSLYELTITNQ